MPLLYHIFILVVEFYQTFVRFALEFRVTYLNWQTCFIALALVGIIIFAAKTILLPETLKNKQVKTVTVLQIIKNYWFLLTHINYLGFVLCASLAFAALFTTGSMLPFLVINKLGVSPSMYGWIAGIPALGYLSGAFTSGKISNKFGKSSLITFSLILDIIVLVIALLLNFDSFSLLSLILPLIFFMFGLGCIVSVGAAGSMAPYPDVAGSEAALLGALMFSIASIFTAIGSHLKEATPIPFFSLLLVIIILTCGTLLIVKRGEK